MGGIIDETKYMLGFFEERKTYTIKEKCKMTKDNSVKNDETRKNIEGKKYAMKTKEITLPINNRPPESIDELIFKALKIVEM